MVLHLCSIADRGNQPVWWLQRHNPIELACKRKKDKNGGKKGQRLNKELMRSTNSSFWYCMTSVFSASGAEGKDNNKQHNTSSCTYFPPTQLQYIDTDLLSSVSSQSSTLPGPWVVFTTRHKNTVAITSKIIAIKFELSLEDRYECSGPHVLDQSQHNHEIFIWFQGSLQGLQTILNGCR